MTVCVAVWLTGADELTPQPARWLPVANSLPPVSYTHLALYILGDLFEAWIGDDDPNPLHHQMAAAIKAVSLSLIHIFVALSN